MGPRLVIQKAVKQGTAAVEGRLYFFIQLFRVFAKVHVSLTLYLLYKV